MEELLRLLDDYNYVSSGHRLLIAANGDVALIKLSDYNLEITYHKYIGNLRSKDNEPARTIEKYIRAVTIASKSQKSGLQALYGEDD